MDSRRRALAGSGKLAGMWSEPLVRLPERVCLTLAEAGDVLFAVDVAVERSNPESREGRVSRRVRLVVTERMWPDLGMLLRDEE